VVPHIKLLAHYGNFFQRVVGARWRRAQGGNHLGDHILTIEFKVSNIKAEHKTQLQIKILRDT